MVSPGFRGRRPGERRPPEARSRCQYAARRPSAPLCFRTMPCPITGHRQFHGVHTLIPARWKGCRCRSRRNGCATPNGSGSGQPRPRRSWRYPFRSRRSDGGHVGAMVRPGGCSCMPFPPWLSRGFVRCRCLHSSRRLCRWLFRRPRSRVQAPASAGSMPMAKQRFADRGDANTRAFGLTFGPAASRRSSISVTARAGRWNLCGLLFFEVGGMIQHAAPVSGSGADVPPPHGDSLNLRGKGRSPETARGPGAPGGAVRRPLAKWPLSRLRSAPAAWTAAASVSRAART